MLIAYLRRLSGKHRSEAGNRELGFVLAFIAGAANAGGFLAVSQYTSHMSGIVSAMADNLAAGDILLMLAGIGAFLSFVAGAACSSILINWARHRQMESEYALPLMVEALLMLCFGLAGGNLARHIGFFVSITVMLLCFIMGLQNAISSKMSGGSIRTTHMTGVVTDIGIELGKLFYWNRTGVRGDPHYVAANRRKLRTIIILVSMFFSGGLVGALGFSHIGFSSTIPLALMLMLLAFEPLAEDLATYLQR
ncbi:YoaK family protein [Herbaspirillum sp. RTI4]|nr:YoaK family protein [Herbaspirillum sp. RTI4]MDY7578097.1 YoaK family protein [Herbaspirillum sp. RTI4]MEA9980686.1 YoaK family protein [Herbaspirillum sp. RTI4]